jgi:hypothetical protein
MRVLLTLLSTFVLFLVGTTVACAADGSFVLIDKNEQAYTVFMVIPEDKVQEVEARFKEGGEVILVTWHDFSDRQDEFIASRIKKDEYTGSRAVEGISALLEKYPGVPFGLTWNGGIAFTYNDYQHAKRTYNLFANDPEEYERNRIRDPRRDPVKPEWHLGPLLGW